MGDTAYVIGGYTGTTELNTIIAYTPGSAPQIVATLPVAAALSGPAAAAIGGAGLHRRRLDGRGRVSATVYRFDSDPAIR